LFDGNLVLAVRGPSGGRQAASLIDNGAHHLTCFLY